MRDKNGTEIRAGDVVYNPADKDKYHHIIESDGELFLDDLDSPLERYHPETYWEVVKSSRVNQEQSPNGTKSEEVR